MKHKLYSSLTPTAVLQDLDLTLLTSDGAKFAPKKIVITNGYSAEIQVHVLQNAEVSGPAYFTADPTHYDVMKIAAAASLTLEFSEQEADAFPVLLKYKYTGAGTGTFSVDASFYKEVGIV